MNPNSIKKIVQLLEPKLAPKNAAPARCPPVLIAESRLISHMSKQLVFNPSPPKSSGAAVSGGQRKLCPLSFFGEVGWGAFLAFHPFMFI